ncbi:MAG: tRNA lysidine(34) synthetase TilS [Tatlockia sp.]|nr:tRNA lysidine(34) synthetase TilS [Tatlockia sp.]
MISLTAYWLEQLNQYDRLLIGFSGGLDSTVLLHNLAMQRNLAKKLIAIHVNHGLSANALHWQHHCQQVAQNLAIPLIIKQVILPLQTNIEEEARKVRYQAFASELKLRDCLLLAHHKDDQAETLLLQLFRGAGIDGLCAMPSKKEFANAHLLRPFLKLSRQELEVYGKAHQLNWIEDESNQNSSFSRNYLRQQVLPDIRARWPSVTINLARTANHCQQAQTNLQALAKIDCPALNENSTSLAFSSLIDLNFARISNVLRYWFKARNIKLPTTKTFIRIIKELIYAKTDASPQVSWGSFCLRRYQQKIYLMQTISKTSLRHYKWLDFPAPLLIEGFGLLKVINVEQSAFLEQSTQIELCFRQGGEVFNYRGQHKQLKKLMQEWQVPPWLRDRIPLLFVDGKLAVIVGYAVSDFFYKRLQENCSFLEFILDPFFENRLS